MLLPINLLIILYYCLCLSTKRTVLVISILDVIAIIVIIAYDILGTTVVPDLRGFANRTLSEFVSL
jgi:hypothetical protein